MPAEESNGLQEIFDNSRRRILSILDDALLLTQIEVNVDHFKSAAVSLHMTLSRAIEMATEFAKFRRVDSRRLIIESHGKAIPSNA